uniref:2Fe-2S ferredoxin-type domain-containing protein n=1 Tax=Aegilops tauschii subsp. strangulata TaxID=200361 RepID=A0A453H2G9_AEGTS
MSMLEAAHENDIELEGACEGSLACSTCHVIVMDVKDYNKLEDPTDEENDMLDLAFGLTETIRSFCKLLAKRSYIMGWREYLFIAPFYANLCNICEQGWH